MPQMGFQPQPNMMQQPGGGMMFNQNQMGGMQMPNQQMPNQQMGFNPGMMGNMN